MYDRRPRHLESVQETIQRYAGCAKLDPEKKVLAFRNDRQNVYLAKLLKIEPWYTYIIISSGLFRDYYFQEVSLRALETRLSPNEKSLVG